jgi:hypothetical protein
MKIFSPKQNSSSRAIFQTLFLTLAMLFSVSAQVSAQCEADAGGFAAQQLCMNDGSVEISATPAGDAVEPDGFSTIYVLTGSQDLVILDVNEEPSFTVDAPAGMFTIHTLVYDPNTLDLSIVEFGTTTGVDVNNLLIQGGGDICASLDVTGAVFRFGGCDDGCAAEAGTLMAGESTCLDGTATLTATVGEAPAVPTGYSVLYVLTSGEDLVIEQVGETPSFEVTEEGRFTIHTLVYDPNTLDLSIVEFGTTTGVDVNNLLIQGGGDICAALDVAGAPFDVELCEDACVADAGTLLADEDACFTSGAATLTATRDEEANVPEGFELIYVLTSGEGLVIEQVNAEPTFEVEETGLYTIHTLVYDPNTLDLGIVEFGTTTGVDVNNLLIQGGGDICAALDVAGAPFDVELCENACLADAGTVRAFFQPCVSDGSATLIGGYDEQPTVPEGFQTLFVLTSGDGLVIEDVNTEARFEVESRGLYRIHSLVYDPNTLDLGIVEFGVTTGFDVNGLLEQGGGDICASLDVAGAVFSVRNCPTGSSHLEGEIKAFPNPANNLINIDLPSIENTDDVFIQLMDNNGKVVKQMRLEGVAQRASMDIADQAPGMYHLIISSDDTVLKQVNVVKAQ